VKTNGYADDSRNYYLFIKIPCGLAKMRDKADSKSVEQKVRGRDKGGGERGSCRS
jgi:hypothetical protein